MLQIGNRLRTAGWGIFPIFPLQIIPSAYLLHYPPYTTLEKCKEKRRRERSNFIYLACGSFKTLCPDSTFLNPANGKTRFKASASTEMWTAKCSKFVSRKANTPCRTTVSVRHSIIQTTSSPGFYSCWPPKMLPPSLLIKGPLSVAYTKTWRPYLH